MMDPFAPFTDFSDFWAPPNGDHAFRADAPWPSLGEEVATPAVQSVTAHSPQQASQQGYVSSVPLLQIDEWDQAKSYDEHPPTCIHYSIEWKLKVKGSYKYSTDETEDNLVLAPGAYWERVLHPKIKALLQQKLPSNKSFRPDEVKMTVFASGRGTRKLTKRFDDLDLDWSDAEKKLQEWSGLFLTGKTLTIELVMNVVEVQPSSGSSRGQKRKTASSATELMLAERATVIDEEVEATGQEPSWVSIYELFRCPGGSCNNRYCWINSKDGKHVKVSSRMMNRFVEYAQSGKTLTTHDDVPAIFREQLYAEEEEEQTSRARRRQKTASNSGQPIHINVHTAQSPPAAEAQVTADTQGAVAVDKGTRPRLPISSLRDTAVVEYCQWHVSQDGREHIQAEYCKARDLTLEEGLDLQLIHELDNVDFFSTEVKEFVAIRWVRDIQYWVSNHHH